MPTRLLDWTRSPYVGLYFAVEEPSIEKLETGDFGSSLWAIDGRWLEEKETELSRPAEIDFRDLSLRAKHLNDVMNRQKTDVPLIVRIDPLETHQRIVAQQGLFLCRLKHQATFSQILMTMMIHPTLQNRPVIRRIVVDSSCRIEFLRKLMEMNIHRASLFPGLDGFGRSLRIELEMRTSFAAAAQA